MPPSSPLTPTSYVVLGLLASHGPSTPYEMEQRVDASLGHFWSFPHSQLYSEPARLLERGLVEEQREQGGRRRRTFTLTESGRTALQDWLGARTLDPPVGTEIRDLGLLKLFFGAAARGKDDVVANARAQADAHRARLEVYAELARIVDEPHAAATLRLGTAYEQAALAFWTSIASADGGAEQRLVGEVAPGPVAAVSGAEQLQQQPVDGQQDGQHQQGSGRSGGSRVP